jgi:hypothetical protein
MWIEILPKKIIQDKVIISKNMNCPKKKNSVNANKSNYKKQKLYMGRNICVIKISWGKSASRIRQTPQFCLSTKDILNKKKIFQAIFKL